MKVHAGLTKAREKITYVFLGNCHFGPDISTFGNFGGGGSGSLKIKTDPRYFLNLRCPLVPCHMFHSSSHSVELPRVPDVPSACLSHSRPENEYVSNYNWVEGRQTDCAIESSMGSGYLWKVACQWVVRCRGRQLTRQCSHFVRW